MKKQTLLALLWGLLGAPIFAIAFSAAVIAGWYAINFNAPGMEQRMAVGGGYHWFLINPVIGYALAWVPIWWWRRPTVQHRSLNTRILQVLGCVVGGYLIWMMLLFLADLPQRAQRWQWQWQAERGARQGDPQALMRMGSTAKDTATALGYYQAAAEKGSMDALLVLGMTYSMDEDLKSVTPGNPFLNYPEAVRCFEKIIANSAERADDARMYLGEIYANPQFSGYDPEKAVQIFTPVGKKFTTAARFLGLHYLRKKDYGQALEYFSFCSQNDDHEGKAYLGVMYENGWGIEKDFAKAHRLYQEAGPYYSQDVVKSLRDEGKR